MNLDDKLSPIVKTLAPSGIRRFFDLVSQNPNAISLGVGEPDFTTPWHVRDRAITSLEAGQTSYTSNQGMPELISQICRYLDERYELSYTESEVMVTFGASEAIDLAFRAILAPGDEVLVPEPCYVSYTPCVEMAGGKPVTVPTHARHGFKLKVDELQKRVTPRTKALIVNYPNNPTGAVMTREDWLPIIKWVKQEGILVISDEIYSELTYKGNHVSLASLPDMKDHVILINGFSKAFAMTGWRIGYAAAPEPILQGMLKIHQYTALCAPNIGQIAALEALENGLAECEAMVSQYDRRRRLVVKVFQDLGLTCHEPQGAFYVFPSISVTGMDAHMFAERLLAEEEVAVVPGDVFGANGAGHIRCSYATSIEKLETAFSRIERFLKRHRQTEAGPAIQMHGA